MGPFQCEICEDVFPSKQLFVDHIRTEHRNIIDLVVLRSLQLDLKKRKEKVMSAEAVKKQRRKSVKRKVEIEERDLDREFVAGKRKYTSLQELQYRDRMGNILPKSAGKWPGLCRVCGKTISRTNEMFKHRQTHSCQASLRHRGLRHRSGGVLVVTVLQDYSPAPASLPQGSHSREKGWE